MRKARSEVKGLPAGFRYYNLRHYFTSLLIADGADVKSVQTSKYSSNSCGVGRSRTASISFSRL
jgi:hypothetical protein